jgi:hypothetical protein
MNNIIVKTHIDNECNEDELYDDIQKLDTSWIDKFEKEDELYKDFYKDNVYFVDLKVVYINRSNEIEKIKQAPFLMTKPNCITREEILEILKKSAMEDNRKYSLLSILRYNILLEPDEIKNYLLDSAEDENNYLNAIKNIDTIYFEKTINMFQDLNEIILLFYEKSDELKKVNPNTCTKRVYLGDSLSSKKKTIKKRYKE